MLRHSETHWRRTIGWLECAPTGAGWAWSLLPHRGPLLKGPVELVGTDANA